MASHLNMDERKRISELRESGYSRGQIAQVLARSKSSISRELERNRVGALYCPLVATQKAQQRRRERNLVRKMDRPEIGDQVRAGLLAYHSPDEIAGRMKLAIPDPRQRISATSIYRWIRRQPPGGWGCRCSPILSPGFERRQERYAHRHFALPVWSGRLEIRRLALHRLFCSAFVAGARGNSPAACAPPIR